MSHASLGKMTATLVVCALATLVANSLSPVQLNFERAVASQQDDLLCTIGVCPNDAIYARSAVNISDYRRAPPLNGKHVMPAAMRPQISTFRLFGIGLVGLAAVGRLKARDQGVKRRRF
jgi:hypothetical protein